MFKRKSFCLTAIAFGVLFLSAHSLTAQTPKRITFRRGAMSATVSGKIGSNGYLEYLINGKAGQVMSIDITSGNVSV